MSDLSTRREFLTRLAILLGGSAVGQLGLDSLAADRGVKLLPWAGDDFTIGHRLRNGEIPKFPVATERKVDFVIVGGGMAALSCAHYLRNHNTLLLEQYSETGGQSRGASAHGMWYSIGAQYLTDINEDVGHLLADMKLKPAKLGTEKNSWLENGQWLKGIDGNSNTLYRDFQRMKKDFAPLWKKMGNATMFVSSLTPELLSLDKQKLSSVLTGYSAPFMDLVNGFLKASTCSDISGLSALSGISTLEDLVIPSYLLEGGNPALARALSTSLKKSAPQNLVTNAFVWSASMTDDGASVVYQSRDGAMHRVSCKHVILAIPPMVASRVLSNIRVADKAQMYSFRYGSYLVGNFILKKKVFNSGYDNWLPSNFSFPDITNANTAYDLNGHYTKDMGQILTVYQPYAPGSEGRSVLFEGNRDKFSIELRRQLTKVLGSEFEKSLETISLARYGHAMTVTSPDYFRKMSKLLSGQTDHYSLAHSSYHGLPSAESAVSGARISANRALKIRKTTRTTFGSLPKFET